MVAVALATAIPVMFPAVVSASNAFTGPGGPADAVRSSGLSLSRAPAGLRVAVRRTLGVSNRASARPVQQAELAAKQGARGEAFGFSVAIYGSIAVVGAPFKDSGMGAAYVFVRSRTGNAWSQRAELTASDGAAGDLFGNSVAMYGSTAVVGAPGRNSGAGAAYVFVRSGSVWSRQAELDASDAAVDDSLGLSVALYGSTAVVGAPGKNSGAGAAYVFARSGGTWSQQAELTATDSAAYDQFGGAVAISGSTAVIGAWAKNSYTGAAYVFIQSGATWSQQAELTAKDGATYDHFGNSVAISGSTALVGAPNKNSHAGAAYVFVQSGATWSQEAKLTAKDSAANDSFGTSVALSGSTAVVGALGTSSDKGAAYVFLQSGATWSQQAKLVASDGAADNQFGYSVGLYGSKAVIGAPYKSSRTGAAYVFGNV